MKRNHRILGVVIVVGVLAVMLLEQAGSGEDIVVKVEPKQESPRVAAVGTTPSPPEVADETSSGTGRRAIVEEVPTSKSESANEAGGLAPSQKTAILTSADFANEAANRSPPRIHQQLQIPGGDVAAGEDKTNEKRSTPAADKFGCWVRNGYPVGVPSFVPLLFSLWTEEQLQRMARYSKEDWTVLIGWIPTRFMPPQPKGRKANGDEMEAPTRGRNPEVYREEYNSTWNARVNADRFPWEFQLVHRNAIRVCIRERLHLHELYCSASPTQETVRMYYCPCRHCDKYAPSMVTKTAGKREVVKPMLPQITLKALPPQSVTIPPLEAPKPGRTSECLPVTSAPWLATLQDVKKFAYEGHHNDLDHLLKVQSDENKIVIMTIFNKFWIDHLHNWVYSITRYGQLFNFIIATMDTDSLELCRRQRLPCFDATEFAELERDMVAGGEGQKVGFKRKVTEAMSWIKPRLAVAVLKQGYHFFMIDLDMTWNRNPMPLILKAKADLIHQCDAPAKYSINSGFYLAKANDRTIQFFSNLMVFRPEENSDQTAMKLFARYDHTHQASNECLDKWIFNMKCNYKVEKSVILKGQVETFEWRPFDRNRSKFFWSILHATCLSGAQKKLIWLRTVNAWYLDELDAYTKLKSKGGGDDSATYCLLLPKQLTAGGSQDVRVQQSATVQTVHSSAYTTDIDNAFLASRH
jgi:hypothetical protein